MKESADRGRQGTPGGGPLLRPTSPRGQRSSPKLLGANASPRLAARAQVQRTGGQGLCPLAGQPHLPRAAQHCGPGDKASGRRGSVLEGPALAWLPGTPGGRHGVSPSPEGSPLGPPPPPSTTASSGPGLGGPGGGQDETQALAWRQAVGSPLMPRRLAAPPPPGHSEHHGRRAEGPAGSVRGRHLGPPGRDRGPAPEPPGGGGGAEHRRQRGEGPGVGRRQA